ncbi:hypothetical protein D9619_008074 [Psilocybe cf. subviscida]|uniref:Domain of unknown function at the cortex 1 domain-containing protein n=1 Tax=Psilocybe cf. subviscida TaxID=2480587 RepID=A0A8H5EST6_9AGAR|nr:hypothetical protein D9619_008074 [Psilocybe cf. subviscida]
MAPRLRVLAGTSPESMVPITSLVNTPTPHKLSSRLFEGQVVAHIQGLTDESGNVRDSEYFGREDKAGITWSIQVQGRFLASQSADDVLFGNTFDRPLKLPWGTSAVLKFMHYIDPTLENDLTSSTKPWALSPLIATMPNFQHSLLRDAPHFPPKESIKDDTRQLYRAVVEVDEHGNPVPSSNHLHVPTRSPSSLSTGSNGSGTSSSSFHSASSSRSGGSSGSGDGSGSGSSRSSKIKQAMKKVNGRSKKSRTSSVSSSGREKSVAELLKLDPTSSSQRRSYFANKAHREAVQFGPEDVITTDFCYGFINFAPALSLQLPGGISFDLMKYWDGQPVRFVCCLRPKEGEDNTEPWGEILWCVSIEMVHDDIS